MKELKGLQDSVKEIEQLFTDYEDMKVLKNELFIFDNDRKEYITKVPNNYRKFTLMMLQFKRYSHEII